MNGGVLSKGLNEELRDILNKLASDKKLLNDYNTIQRIEFLIQAKADLNTKGRDGKTLSYYSNEKLSEIVKELAQYATILDQTNNVQYIRFLLRAGADKDRKHRIEKSLLDCLNEKLLSILDDSENDRNPLNDSDGIQRIMFLIQAGANPSKKSKDGKILSDYLSEKLRNILNELASDKNILDNPDRVQHIELLLEAGANPDVQNRDEKTLLHYFAERNDTKGIDLLLKAKADPSIKDQSGKTPFEYITEPDCLEDVKCLGYNKDGSRKNEGNSATPDGSVGDCSNSSGDDDKTISTEPSDCDRKDEDSSCSSRDYLFLEDSLLAKLEIPLITDERKLIDEFCEKIRGITEQESEESILKSIEKIVNEYLEEGIRLNSSCSNDNDNGDKETVTSLIFKEIEGVVNDRGDEYKADEYKTSDIIIKRITSNLLLKGGMGEKFLSGDTKLTNKHYGCDYLDDLKRQYKDRKEELISIACEGIVNKSKQTHEYDLKAEIDNQYFCVKYPQDSIIEPVKIFNKAEALKDKDLNLKVGILQIEESIVRVESIDGKRNYTDILKGSIKMSFTTEVGEINIDLSPSKEGGNKIKVEIDEENKAKFNKLKDKSSLGKNCLLEGENVSEVISKNFKMSDSVSTEPTETIKGVPRTDLTQASSQQIDTRTKGNTRY